MVTLDVVVLLNNSYKPTFILVRASSIVDLIFVSGCLVKEEEMDIYTVSGHYAILWEMLEY